MRQDITCIHQHVRKVDAWCMQLPLSINDGYSLCCWNRLDEIFHPWRRVMDWTALTASFLLLSWVSHIVYAFLTQKLLGSRNNELSFQPLWNICFPWLASNAEATTKTNGLNLCSVSWVILFVSFFFFIIVPLWLDLYWVKLG
jgi:hypothetical protein